MATIANNSRSARTSSLRAASNRSIAASMPSWRHNPSSAHAPPNGAERTKSRSAGAVAISACSGSSTRDSERTNLASAARSSRSSRPKLWITRATEHLRTGSHSLCASCT